MKKWRVLLYLSIILLPFILTLMPIKSSSAADQVVYIIPLEETVEKGLSAFIDRSITDAENKGADVIIFEINTPGGAVDAATKIGKRIQESTIPTVAYVNNDAISAGAFIALNADKIYMSDNGRMGAAGIIDQAGNTADEKAVSYWLSAMKGAAENNGRDPIYALAMADKEIDLPELGAEKGKFLTLTAKQALQVGYAEGVVKDRADLLKTLGFEKAAVEQAELSLAEKIARFITNPIVVSILLTIGSLGLVVELYSPGFGIPGIMGISALLLFFYGHLVAGLAGLESIILFVVGIVLILLEFVLPGGIIGLIGLGAILTSFFLAGSSMMVISISLLVALVATIVVSIILVKIFGKKLHVFKKIILFDSTNSESGYVSNKNRDDLIGKQGIALTTLRPSGTAIINDERLDVVTQGNYIERNTRVEVIKTEGSRIVVREVPDINK
ncbi:nodulation protein NfeD [Fredinandcohnia sp. QZ13]|uniref:NfeD family protein n=1 Tax=Fredinandcohnia sp. QZ13 TaxID=3073144 RepID=UPI002853220B|nr:nodulation protein NfeD [Fredinandcohnia sp. QZ13]MDR4888991.1 nodulation protein NfeD [Fredinandcohnia sp. QZ13]